MIFALRIRQHHNSDDRNLLPYFARRGDAVSRQAGVKQNDVRRVFERNRQGFFGITAFTDYRDATFPIERAVKPRADNRMSIHNGDANRPTHFPFQMRKKHSSE